MRVLSFFGLLFSLTLLIYCDQPAINNKKQSGSLISHDTIPVPVIKSDSFELDTFLYNQKLLGLAHNKPSAKWPVKTAYPLGGAILPFKRIVAYYGNFYTAGMGVLGEQPTDKMLYKLQNEVKKWRQADTLTPVQPALHYVAVTAQRSKGKDRKYRLRMPFDQIDKALQLAQKINAIVFLDIQVGHSTVQQEIPAKKIDSYQAWITNQPVQFTGFKLFYKQDAQGLMQPADILKLYPMPIYIQYQ